MKIIYATLEGTDAPWIDEAIQQKLHWVTDYQFGPEFWGRLQSDLDTLWAERCADFLACPRQVWGFKSMMTNSAVTVYPQVRIS